MTWILAALALALLVTIAILAWRTSGRIDASRVRHQPWRAVDEPPDGPIRLDLGGVDPEDPAVARLVDDVAVRALEVDPQRQVVEVTDRDGRPLGRRERGQLRRIVLPDSLHVEHGPTVHAPSPVPHHEPTRGPLPGTAPDVPDRPLADRLELTDRIRAEVREPDRPVDVLRAILHTSGHDVVVEGDLLRCGDVAIAVADPRHGAEAALTRAFLRIEASGVPRGLVLRTGYVDPHLLRRREAAAPHVRHLGPDAVQRMADAAAVGADPLSFAVAPHAVG